MQRKLQIAWRQGGGDRDNHIGMMEEGDKKEASEVETRRGGGNDHIGMMLVTRVHMLQKWYLGAHARFWGSWEALLH